MKKGTYVICGKSGSGKSLFASFLFEKYGVLPYRFSHPINALLVDMGLPNTRENLSLLSTSLRTHFGDNIFGVAAKKFIEDHPNKTIILEGVRRTHAFLGWRDKIDAIIWIEASPSHRYERIIARGEKSKENLLTKEAFDREDRLESEATLTELRESADIILENNGTKEEFYHKIESLFIEK